MASRRLFRSWATRRMQRSGFFAHLTDDPVRQSIQTAANMILGYAGISKK